ncbi:hypothetical protein CRYUN_Cryun13aG0123300 [Craigia yunnanensis]
MNGSQVRKRKQQPGSLTATSHHASQKHEDSLPHDLLESQDSVQLQGQMALLKALQQNKLQNERKDLILQSLHQFHGAEVKQHARQQIRPHLRQQDICQAPALHPFDGVCSGRLMQHAEWHCDLCGSKSGRGFEVTSEVLPRLNKVSFESGVIDEILFLNMPCERRFPSGLMMLEYEKAVQESVYERLRVVHEGKLRIIFTYDLKILSWEFCARHHEELLQRSFTVPQAIYLLYACKVYFASSHEFPDWGSPLTRQSYALEA